eukprot:g10582.t1
MGALEDRRDDGRELETGRRLLLTPTSVLPPSTKRRRRQTQTCDCNLKPDISTNNPCSAAAADAAPRPGRRTRDRSGAAAAAVVRGALAVLLAGGLGTGVRAFSAVVSAPPRQRPHHKLISTNAHQQPAPMMVPSPSLLGASTPQTQRQFLEDIISGRTAAAEQQHHQQQQEEEGRSFGSNSTILGLTDWGGAGGAFRLKEEPTTRVVAVGRREATRARPRGEERGGEDTGPPRVLRRAPRVAVPAKKAEPKGGYRRSANKRTRAINDMCAELCQKRLLTRAEEYELGTKIQALMRHKELRQQVAARLGRPPSRAEWARACRLTVTELEESLQVGEDAKKLMVEANMRMVISIARKYRHYGVPLKDLIQEGSLGLVRAVEKFDPERGFKLSTYSAWWIQQAVFKGIAHQSRTIRLPVHVHNLLNRVRKAERELTTRKGYQPSNHQVAGHLDLPVKRLQHYLKLTKESVSLETPTDPGSSNKVTKERVLGDTLMDKDRRHPEKEGDALLFRTRLREAVEELSEDERIILNLRFGLEDGKRKSWRQIAEIVRTPQPYVRRVESMALQKLRSPEQARRLRDFTFDSSGFPATPSPAASASVAPAAAASASPSGASSSGRRRGGGGVGAPGSPVEGALTAAASSRSR